MTVARGPEVFIVTSLWFNCFDVLGNDFCWLGVLAIPSIVL